MLPLSSDWYTGDTTTFKSSKIETITSQFGIQQIIKAPTHIQGKSVSCIDLNLSSQPNLVRVPLFTHLFTKITIIIYYLLNSISKSTIHHLTNVRYGILKKANTDHIKRPINELPWERSLTNLDINDKAYLFNKTIKNKLSNFTPHDPPWINSQVKHLVNEKHAIYKNYLKNNKSNQSSETFQSFQSQLSSLIANLKNKYYSNVA